MSGHEIAAIASSVATPPQAVDRALVSSVFNTSATAPASFAQLMKSGVAAVNHQVVEANKIAAAFALDDHIPPHQVMMALEQAKMSMQLLMQVRARLVEGYQDFMRMQL